jgi:hypothetical protein
MESLDVIANEEGVGDEDDAGEAVDDEDDEDGESIEDLVHELERADRNVRARPPSTDQGTLSRCKLVSSVEILRFKGVILADN